MTVAQGFMATPSDQGGSFLQSLLHYPGPNGSAQSQRPTNLDGAKRPGRVYRTKSVSSILDDNDELDRQLNDPRFAPHLHRDKGRDGLAEVAKFLRENDPPASNFMSIPDDDGADGDERGGWAKIRNVTKRSKSVPRRPPNIRLPDSAVSGRTIDGHRHIAITIPLDAYPKDETPRSHYLLDTQADRVTTARAFISDKGVVTVLRPVHEDVEASPSRGSAAEARPRSFIHSLVSVRPPANTNLPLSRSATCAQGSSRTPPLGPIRPLTSTRHQGKSAFPTRTSSVPGPARHHPISIDSVIAAHSNEIRQYSTVQNAPKEKFDVEAAATVPNWPENKGKRPLLAHEGGKPLETFERAKPIPGQEVAKPLLRRDNAGQSSLLDSAGPSSLLASTAPALPHVSIGPSFMHDSARTSAEEEQDTKHDTSSDTYVSDGVSKESGARVLTENPLGTEHDVPTAQQSESGQSRRERVRSKKKRDLDAHKTAKTKQKGQMWESAKTVAGPSKAATEQLERDRKGLRAKPTLSPITVTADIKPSAGALELGIIAAKEEPAKASHPSSGQKDVAKAIQTQTETSQANLPPPQSASNTSAAKHASLDRTSLSRRREWNATREHDRKLKETAKAAARAQVATTGGSGSSGVDESYDHVQASHMDKEILRLYEAYREQRFREMERRVRRLERHGDIWLRALIPVLDNINRSVLPTPASSTPQGSRQQSRQPGEDETAKSAPRRQVDLIRTSSLRRLLREREMAQQAEDADSSKRSSSVYSSDTFNGADSLEPLMTELAGAAKGRLRALESSKGSNVPGGDDKEVVLQQERLLRAF